MICFIGPILRIALICARKLSKSSFPSAIAFCTASSSLASFIFSKSEARSGKPTNSATKCVESKGFRSVVFSPVPMNATFAPVTASELNAPPPLPLPSIFVTITPVTPTVEWNSCACFPATCPKSALTTKNFSSGLNAFATAFSSSANSPSKALLPADSVNPAFHLLRKLLQLVERLGTVHVRCNQSNLQAFRLVEFREFRRGRTFSCAKKPEQKDFLLSQARLELSAQNLLQLV